jgi:hypothetical protein
MGLERADAEYEAECQKGASQFSDEEALAVGRMVLGSLTVVSLGPLQVGIYDHKRAIGVHDIYADGFRTVKIGRTIKRSGEV